MNTYRRVSLPPELEPARRRAKRHAWLSLAFLASVIVPLSTLADSSQIVKAALLEDLLGIVPPIALLVTWRIFDRAPSAEYPHGRVRSIVIAHLVASVALAAMGGYIVVDSVANLVRAEKPTLGAIVLMDHAVWEGWVLVALLSYSTIVPIFLGRAKMKTAHELQDKQLYADAEMNKADWRTGLGSVVGILAIGLGLWWLDPVVAAVLGCSIVRDGMTNLRGAIGDLMGRTPRTVDNRRVDPLVDEVQRYQASSGPIGTMPRGLSVGWLRK